MNSLDDFYQIRFKSECLCLSAGEKAVCFKCQDPDFHALWAVDSGCFCFDKRKSDVSNMTCRNLCFLFQETF